MQEEEDRQKLLMDARVLFFFYFCLFYDRNLWTHGYFLPFNLFCSKDVSETTN